MAEEIAVENGRISLTSTLDRVTLHTAVHHSLTSTYMPNFIEIEKLFMDARTDGHLRPALLGRLCQRVHLKWALNHGLHNGCVSENGQGHSYTTQARP